MNLSAIEPERVNRYIASKQRLLPGHRSSGVVQVTRDVVALHATMTTTPYLSLWARVACPERNERDRFERRLLDDALYEQHSLARLNCMRSTLHMVPSDEFAYFFHAQVGRPTPWTELLVEAGVSPPEEAPARLEQIQRLVLDHLARHGPATVAEISQAVPVLQAKVRYGIDTPYEGDLSIGSRLVPEMCTQGLLVRARPRGSWRSNLYEYTALSEWLPGLDLGSVTPREARIWLVRRYLAAFGPASAADVRWWTGFSARDANQALEALKAETVQVQITGLGDEYLMLACDAERLQAFEPPEGHQVWLLPSMDPYVMGYRDRRRFVQPEHLSAVLDRAGNAVPTVWAGGRAVGAWGQRGDGSVVYAFFEPVDGETRDLIADTAVRLEDFLGGERLGMPVRTAFTRMLE